MSRGDRPVPSTAGRRHDEWEINHRELQLFEELGSGAFGVVRRGKWRGSIDVAVKMIKKGVMSEDQFIAEAEVMTLQHQNLVKLHGVCTRRPIYIVTEYMQHGSLLSYLRREETYLRANVSRLLNICIQVCRGMEYLERQNYIHRDLAARNCLVGSEYAVKISDFGLSRYTHGPYVGHGAGHPTRWVPPEVLRRSHYSSKSDVWAYGVLMWEIFTCGAEPYGSLHEHEVIEYVMGGNILGKPRACSKEVDNIMTDCWSQSRNSRPSFRLLKERLINVSQG